MSWKPRVGETPREVARVDMTAGLFSGVHGKRADLRRRVLEGEVTKRYERLPRARRAGGVYASHDVGKD